MNAVSRANIVVLALSFAGCAKFDAAPTIELQSPTDLQVFPGFGAIPVRVALTDDRSGLNVEVFLDGASVGTATGSGCNRGCSVTVPISTEDLADGDYTISARVEDIGGQVADSEEALFTVYDIPYVHSIAVMNTREGALDGGFEVEVHLLDDDTATWKGCAALTEVQEDGLLYEELEAPFLLNEAGDVVRFTDIGLDVMRVVALESDGNRHCPIWPELTETFEDDVDQIYGMSPPIDFSLLYSDVIVATLPNVEGLEIRRGRPR